jgi:RecA-family ATPase
MTAPHEFAAHMDRVARALLGTPNEGLSNAKQLRFGTHGSLSVDLAKGAYFDHEAKEGGGVLDLIRRAKGLTGVEAIEFMREIGCDIPQPKKANGRDIGKRTLIETFGYTDADGKLIFQVLRYEPKQFLQRQPLGNGQFTWKGGPPLPYKLPELIEAVALGKTVFIAEGERKVDALAHWNIPATCNAGGANKWTAEHSKYLHGADVIILPDNDEAGRKHANTVGAALQGIAKSVRLLELPDLEPKGDIKNWIEAGGTPAVFWRLVETQARPWAWYDDCADIGARLAWLDMSNWDNEPVPERKWAILNRVPLNQAGLFSGEGGTGKSIIELMKDVAHVAGKDWLGSMPECGPAFYIGAEDEADELHRRLADIAAYYQITFVELIKRGLHVLCKLGEDATLCAVSGKSGKVEPTAFYHLLYEAAGDIKPKNISIDTLSRAFAGNEIDRVQVYAFAMHMQALAMVAGGSVTVLSHPSLQGIASGSGLSGSTAWHGAFRFRQYLKGIKPTDGEQPDGDVRELAFLKNQYGPSAEAIVLRYQRGLFLPERGTTSLEKAAREARVEEIFLRGLGIIIQQGRDAIAGQNSPEFGPNIIAGLQEAKTEGISRKELAEAMDRLLAAGKVHIGKTNGPPSKAKKCIVLGGPQ